METKAVQALPIPTEYEGDRVPHISVVVPVVERFDDLERLYKDFLGPTSLSDVETSNPMDSSMPTGAGQRPISIHASDPAVRPSRDEDEPRAGTT